MKNNDIKTRLDNIFYEIEKCKENKLSIDKKDIEFIFKPDKGIKNEKLQKKLFPNKDDPKLCDCIIQKDGLILLELKYEIITASVFKTIKEKLLNVGTILKKIDIDFNRTVLVYHTLDNNQMKKLMAKVQIMGKRIKCVQFQKTAIKL